MIQERKQEYRSPGAMVGGDVHLYFVQEVFGESEEGRNELAVE